jgi:hypothetical protein
VNDVDTNGSHEVKKRQEFVQNVKAHIGTSQEKKPESIESFFQEKNFLFFIVF